MEKSSGRGWLIAGMVVSLYLQDSFTRLAAAKITQIKEFTPAAWTKV